LYYHNIIKRLKQEAGSTASPEPTLHQLSLIIHIDKLSIAT